MFIGFAIGTLCLFGLFRAIGRRRGYGGFHPYGGYAYGFAGHHHGFGGHRRGFWRHRHHRDGYGPHEGYGHHDLWGDDSPPARGDRPGPWGRGRGFVHALLGRLDATPVQEKAIMTVIDELTETVKELRGTGHDVRAEVARAIRGPLLDDVILEGASARIDDATQKLRNAVKTAIIKIHEALDDRQRKLLGDIIDSSWRGAW